MGSHHTPKMGEGNKQVRVDNWGIFFLQRLQMFFNKTDYCDLTLQFEGNVQLKVHRLVMNACTEYFQVLEQTCEMVDDVLIMPPDLQADVVLPIVNFMYTGMLEFHMSIFDKLYKTANLMNITVLTKLLDAQKSPIQSLPKPTTKRTSTHTSHAWNLHGKRNLTKSDSDLPATLPGRKLPIWKRKSAPIAVPHTVVSHLFPEQKRSIPSDPLGGIDNTPKPTRFEWPEEELTGLNIFDSNFDEISYTSKPLLTQEDEPRPSTSFDRIKETPDSARKSSNYNNSTIDMEAVKDYVKEQKIRSNMTEEDDDDGVDNDFDSNDVNTDSSQDSQKRKLKVDLGSSKRVRFSINEKENQVKQTKINITPTGKTTSDVDHTKIISEVLKKYPNLVKKNKNIRLKILAKSNTTPHVTEQVKKLPLKKVVPKVQHQNVTTSTTPTKTVKSVLLDEKNEDGPWKCQRCSTPGEPVEFVLYYLFRKHMTDVHNEKFDSRMCKFCGHKSTKHNMLMYHQYTKHGVKPPLAYNFPKCNQCPYIALTDALLIKHKTNHTKYELQCVECKVAFVNQHALTSHSQITGHTGKSGKFNYDCQYCIKKFQSGSNLFSHIRMQHRDDARRDGVVSIDETVDHEEEEGEQMETEEQELDTEQESFIASEMGEKKIKILSDVKLSSMELQQGNTSALSQQNITLEPSSEAEALSNVATGIATSLGLVDVVVLDENQQFILHTNNEENINSREESEFILPDLQDAQNFTTTQQQVITTEQNVLTQSMLHSSDIGSTDELVMVLTDHDYGDGNTEVINNENSNIVVLYSHPVEGQENQFITSQGNLMLTSQSGLIELRNSNAIVTSSSSQFISSSADRSSENTQIESIEMIQREIDQHPDSKNQVEVVENAKSTMEQAVVPESAAQQEILPPEPENSSCTEETSEMQEQEVEQPTVSEDAKSETDTNSKNTQEKSKMETNDNVQEVSDTSGHEISDESVYEVNQSVDEAAQKETVEIEEDGSREVHGQDSISVLEQTDSNETKEAPVPETDNNMQLEETNNGTAIDDDKTNVTETDDVEMDEAEANAPKSNELEAVETTSAEQQVSEPVMEQVETQEDVPPKEELKIEKLKTIEQDEVVVLNIDDEGTQIEEPPTQETIIVSEGEKSSENENENIVDITNHEDKTEDEPSIKNTDVIEVHSTTVDNEDEVVQIQEESSENSQASQNSSVDFRSKQSAKIILDDWEDTDSQQSENKNVDSVNKLIDDWDDDDDENKKV